MQTRIKRLVSFINNEYTPIYYPLRAHANMWLNIDDLKNLSIYYGTYFRRSCAIVYNTFCRIFELESYQSVLNKNQFNFLSIGGGAGADTIGFIEAFEKYSAGKNIELTIIEGNKLMMDSAKKTLEFYLSSNFKNTYIIKYLYNERISESNTIELINSSNSNYLFDFVSCCKFLNETTSISYNDYFFEISKLVDMESIAVTIVNSSERSKNNISSFEWKHIIKEIDTLNMEDIPQFLLPLCFVKRSIPHLKIVNDEKKCHSSCEFCGVRLKDVCFYDDLYNYLKTSSDDLDESVIRIVTYYGTRYLNFIDDIYFSDETKKFFTTTLKKGDKKICEILSARDEII